MKYGTWPLLLPSSALYMMTIGGQVRMNWWCSQFTYVYITFLSVVEPAAKVGMQSSKASSKSKLQKKSSTSVTRSRSDVSTRTSSSGLVNTPTTGPAVEREEGRKRGQERLNRDLLRTLAETHCIHAEVCSSFVHTHTHTFYYALIPQCAVYHLKEGGNELGHGISSAPRSQQATETTVANSIE